MLDISFLHSELRLASRFSLYYVFGMPKRNESTPEAKPRNLALGRHLDVLMATKGINQAELARLSGVAATRISRYLDGSKAPDFETVRRLLAAMDYSMASLSSAEKLCLDLLTTHRPPTAEDEYGETELPDYDTRDRRETPATEMTELRLEVPRELYDLRYQVARLIDRAFELGWEYHRLSAPSPESPPAATPRPISR
jgi:transcriptional regulator with XRE-family HTH domain